MQRFTSRLLNLIASAESSDDGARSGFEACWCKRCDIPTRRAHSGLLTSPTRSVVSLSVKIYTHTHRHAHAHSISRNAHALKLISYCDADGRSLVTNMGKEIHAGNGYTAYTLRCARTQRLAQLSWFEAPPRRFGFSSSVNLGQ